MADSYLLYSNYLLCLNETIINSKNILNHLNKNEKNIVLCDRFIYTFFPYFCFDISKKEIDNLIRLNSNGSIVQYSDRRFQFASIGSGLTDTEASNFYTAVQAMQTTLSRNV